MPKARTIQQQRKRRVRMSKEAPFPVPIATVTREPASNSNWIYYTCTLHDHGVIVHHTGDMDFLYKMGFFGKGSMSRAQPQWGEHQRVVALRRPAGHSGGWMDLLHARVQSRRRYMTHLKWRLISAGDDATLTRAELDQRVIAEDLPQPPHQNLDGEPSFTKEVFNTPKEDVQNWEKMETEEEKNDGRDACEKVNISTEADWGEGEGDAEFWGTGDEGVSEKSEAVASWDKEEGDAEFWGTEEADVKSSSSGCVHSSQSADVQSRVGETVSNGSDSISSSSAVTVASTTDHPKLVSHKDERLTDSVLGETASQLHQSECIDRKNKENESSKVEQSEKLSSEISLSGSSWTKGNEGKSEYGDHPAVEHTSLQDSSLPCSETKDTDCVTDTLSRDNVGLSIVEHPDKVNGFEASEETPAGRNEIKPCGSISETCTEESDAHTSTTISHPGKADHIDKKDTTLEESASCRTDASVEWSEFCQNDDDDVSSLAGRRLFVIEDSDEEEVGADGRVYRTRTKWRPIVKRDPFPVKEHLHLSYEEAFFLSYGLGCLTVLDSQKTPLTLCGLWKEFCRRQPDFLPNYIAYHYYRSKNWVPKIGLKFGCTFLLYKDGPPFYHGSYSVVVKLIDEEGNPVEGYGGRRQFSWASLAGLKRITEHVGKELLMCYVIKPSDMTSQDMVSPACIPRFKIKEVLVSRWVSSQERESSALEDLP